MLHCLVPAQVMLPPAGGVGSLLNAQVGVELGYACQ